jgi:signal transduction histidine kinase
VIARVRRLWPARGTVEGTAISWTPEHVAIAVRAIILALCLALSAITPHRNHQLSWIPLLIGLGVAASSYQGGVVGRLLRIAESVGCAVAVIETGAPDSTLFAYLIAPAFAGGLIAGFSAAAVTPGFAALALLVGMAFINTDDAAFAGEVAQWVVLAVASSLVGAWIKRLLRPDPRSSELVDTTYAAAYRLLAQLRPVARQLSVGLDPVTIADGLLQTLRSAHEFDRGAVFVRTGASRLVPLSFLGTDRVEWDVDVTDDGAFADAWLSQRPQRLTRQFGGAPGSALVIPLVIGLRSFGIVGFETARRSLSNADAADAAKVVEEAALRLETALLFDEVRGVATAEERRRLAREIHDGIAQELSYLGYFVDGLGATAGDGAAHLVPELQQLRQEITRIISELRLSIFDLRSEVDAQGGLGAALSEYVRSVGRQSGLTVHLSLTEAANRLPAETEAELLRIAQEAITNARKHASAENLWVTLEVDPPRALLRVEDDGRGLGKARADSYGLQIMRERAGRLRTSVDVAPRDPRGTRVEVRLAGAGERASLGEAPERALTGAEEMPRR